MFYSFHWDSYNFNMQVRDSPDLYEISKEQGLVVWVVTLLVSALSLFGSSFMLITIFMYGKKKGLSQMIVYLALGDWGWSLTVVVRNILLLIYKESSYEMCVGFRVMVQFFGGSTVFWTTCISFFLYRCVFSKESAKDSRVFQVEQKILAACFHIISWGIPLAFCITLISRGDFSQEPVLKTCFPKEKPHFYMWFLPILVCFGVSVTVYAKLMLRLRNTMSWRLIVQGFRDQSLSLPFRISLYLLVFFVCWGLDFAQYIVITFSTRFGVVPPKSTSLFAVTIAYNVMLQSQGVLDFLVYGIANKEVRKRYSDRKWFCLGMFFLSPILVVPCILGGVTGFFDAQKKEEYDEIPSRGSL